MFIYRMFLVFFSVCLFFRHWLWVNIGQTNCQFPDDIIMEVTEIKQSKDSGRVWTLGQLSLPPLGTKR